MGWHWSLKFFASQHDVRASVCMCVETCSESPPAPFIFIHNMALFLTNFYTTSMSYNTEGPSMSNIGVCSLTLRSLCTMSCWWMWLTLSRIWLMQWLEETETNEKQRRHKSISWKQQLHDKRAKTELKWDKAGSEIINLSSSLVLYVCFEGFFLFVWVFFFVNSYNMKD